MLDTRSWAPGLLALSILSSGSTASAQGPGVKPPARELVRSVRVAPGSLKGRVLASGTRTPVENQTITVRTPDGTQVSKTVTRPDGTYEIQSLTEGDHVVSVGDSVRVDLSVAPDATITTLDIVMPPGTVMPPATPPGGAAAAAPARTPAPAPVPAPKPAPAAPVAGGGLGVVGWGLIAVGATAAVAVPVVIASQDDDETTVSPAGSRIRR